MIDRFTFGRMIVDGQSYAADLVIFPDRIHSSWRRKEGHVLCLEDLQDIFREEIEALVIGTGFFGLLKVKDEVKEAAAAKGIHLVIEKTAEAFRIYNDLSGRKKTVGAFHLTC